MNRRPYKEGSIYQTKNGKWIASISYVDPLTGKRKRPRKHARTKTEAKVLLTQMRKEFADIGRMAERTRTVSVALEGYEGYRHLNPDLAQATLDNDAWLMGVIADELGKIKTCELSPSDCERLLRNAAIGIRKPDGSRRRPIGPERIRRIRNMLINVLNNEMRLGHLHRNVAQLSFAPSKSSKAKKKRKSMKLDDFEKLLEVAQGPVEILIELVGRYGLRPAEARALQWESVDLESTFIMHVVVEMDKHNNRGPVKTDKARRRVLLADDTVERFISWRDEQLGQIEILGSNWVDETAIPTTPFGVPLDRYQFNARCEELCEEAGITRITPYQLRHTAISYQAKRGHNAWEIADWSGTSEKMVSDVYRDELNDVSTLRPI